MRIALAAKSLAVVALALTACTPAFSQPARSATPSPFFPIRSTSTASATQSLALSTSTPREWPPPNFGTPGPTQVTPLPLPAPVISRPGTFNILLAGSDRRTTSFRTDVLIVVNFQPEYDLVTMLSIPRDLYVYIPGWQMQRINTAYYHGLTTSYPGGGPALLKDTILYNLGIEIDRVAMVDFDGFIKIIDTLGGVDVPVACSYTDWHIINPRRSAEDENNWKLYTVKAGIAHMDGDLALWYSRSRKKSSDFDRSRRQQEVLRAIYAQALQLNTLTKVPELYRQVSSSLETDMDLDYILHLLPYSARVGEAQVRSVFINKEVLLSWRTPTGAAVLLPDLSKLPALLARALGPPLKGQSRESESLIEIRNRTDWESLPELVAERLNYAGFETRVLDGQGEITETTRLISLQPEVDEAEVEYLLQVLGMSAGQFRHDPSPNSTAKFRLVLGEDFNPCFDPAKIER